MEECIVVMTLSILVAAQREERCDGGSSGILSLLSSVGNLCILGILNVISAAFTDTQSFLELFLEGSTVLKERNSNENNKKDFLDVFHEMSNVIFVKGLREVFEHFIF